MRPATGGVLLAALFVAGAFRTAAAGPARGRTLAIQGPDASRILTAAATTVPVEVVGGTEDSAAFGVDLLSCVRSVKESAPGDVSFRCRVVNDRKAGTFKGSKARKVYEALQRAHVPPRRRTNAGRLEDELVLEHIDGINRTVAFMSELTAKVPR